MGWDGMSMGDTAAGGIAGVQNISGVGIAGEGIDSGWNIRVWNRQGCHDRGLNSRSGIAGVE